MLMLLGFDLLGSSRCSLNQQIVVACVERSEAQHRVSALPRVIIRPMTGFMLRFGASASTATYKKFLICFGIQRINCLSLRRKQTEWNNGV
jgi:hypothetical protein